MGQKDWLSRCNQNKRKTVDPHITHLMCSLVLLLTISLQLVASYNRWPPSLLAFASFLCSLTDTMSKNFGKFQEFGVSKFDGPEKDRYFLKILKWQHKLVRDYKRGTLVSYFLNNACLYGLKISENIEIEHVSQSKSFSHFSDNLHTSCFSVFKRVKWTFWVRLLYKNMKDAYNESLSCIIHFTVLHPFLRTPQILVTFIRHLSLINTNLIK